MPIIKQIVFYTSLYNIIVMIDLIFWLIILVIGFVGFMLGSFFKVSPLFFLGVALVMASGILLWGSGGLLLERQVAGVDDNGVITYVDVGMSIADVSVQMLALTLVGSGIVSLLVFDFGGVKAKRQSPFHY